MILLAGCGVTGSADPPTGEAVGTWHVARTNDVSVRSEPGTRPQLAFAVAAELERIRSLVGRDFESYPAVLRVVLFASHRSFARALWSWQRQRPQNARDDTGSIVHGLLLLGPLPRPYLRHNLAHVYTEWVIDRLMGNRSDVLPSGTWLYDGLAEFEAYRYAPAGMRCSVRNELPFDITRVRTARRWLALRAGPLGTLEYCLAYTRVRVLVARLGWANIVYLLHQPGGWDHFVQAVQFSHVPTRTSTLIRVRPEGR